MHYIWWIVIGFVCLFASGSFEWIGERGVTPTDRLPYYVAAMIPLGGAVFCFIKGGAGAIQAIRVQIGDAPPPEPKAKKVTAVTRPAKRLADGEQGAAVEASDFDPDAALARYMARRDQAPAEAQAEADVTSAPATQVQPERRPADSGKRKHDDQGDFDPDAALARYMSRRDASAAQGQSEADPAVDNAEATAQPFPPELRPAVRPTFGRKVS